MTIAQQTTYATELELVVATLLREGVTPADVAGSMRGAEGDLFCRVEELVRQLGDATLGIIAACGSSDPSRTTLYSVHCGTWIGKYSSGRQILERVAATAIVAVISDRVPWNSRW